MHGKTILIIEDEPGIAESVAYALKLEGFSTRWESLGLQGLEIVKQHKVDLIVLDVGLPDINGLEVCKQLRKFTNIPVLFLTARGEEIDRIVGLEIGGDDYMVKPFSPRELAARAKAILRRGELLPFTSERKKENLKIDQEKRLASYFGQPLPLTKFEYEILLILSSTPERVYSREQLMTAIWPEPAESFDRAVDTHIKTLRAKLREISNDKGPIITHRGVGYSFKFEMRAEINDL